MGKPSHRDKVTRSALRTDALATLLQSCLGGQSEGSGCSLSLSHGFVLFCFPSAAIYTERFT